MRTRFLEPSATVLALTLFFCAADLRAQAAAPADTFAVEITTTLDGIESGVGPQGAELRQTLGTAVFSGMIGVTAFGLIFTPVFYVVSRAIASRREAATRSASPKSASRSA